jgi:hypothetical protein
VRLFELFQDSSQQNIWWAIGLSDGNAPPTSGDSTGFVLPTTRSWFEFEGYLASFPIEFPLGGVQQGTVTIQRSGPATFTKKTT